MIFYGRVLFLVYCSFGLSWTFSFVPVAAINADVESQIPKARCGPINTTIPESVTNSHWAELGDQCTLKSGKPGKKMINDALELDCLPCCQDHYWEEDGKLCRPCPQGSWQREGVYTSCLDSPSESDGIGKVISMEQGQKNEYSEQGKRKRRRPNAPDIIYSDATNVTMQWCYFCLPYETVEIQLFNNTQNRDPSIFYVSAATNNFTFKNLVPDRHYSIRIRGADMKISEYSLWSNGVAFTTKPTLEPPSNFQVSVSDCDIIASWNMTHAEHNLKKKLKCDCMGTSSAQVFLTYDSHVDSPLKFSLPCDGRHAISMSYIDQDGHTSPWTAPQMTKILQGCKENGYATWWIMTLVTAIVSFGLGFTAAKCKRCGKRDKSNSNGVEVSPTSTQLNLNDQHATLLHLD